MSAILSSERIAEINAMTVAERARIPTWEHYAWYNQPRSRHGK